MTTESAIAARIAHGVRRLDAHFATPPSPCNWRARVNPDILDLSSVDRDILGQVFGSFYAGMAALFPDDLPALAILTANPATLSYSSFLGRLNMWRLAMEHGFDLPSPSHSEDYDDMLQTMNRLWISHLHHQERAS